MGGRGGVHSQAVGRRDRERGEYQVLGGFVVVVSTLSSSSSSFLHKLVGEQYPLNAFAHYRGEQPGVQCPINHTDYVRANAEETDRKTETETQRDRKRQRGRKRDRETETDRQIKSNQQTDRQRQRQTEREV